MFFQITTIGVEVLMAITGILALIFGRFPYRPGRPVTGVGAYVGGAILIMPLAIALPLGYSMLRDPSTYTDNLGKVIFLHAGFIVDCFCTAYILAALLNNPLGGTDRRQWLKEVEARKTKRRKKRRGDDEEDEDRGSRRRRRRRDDDDVPRRGRGDEDDEDRPRRADAEDDDEPPRRREPDDDDEPPRRRREPDDDDDRITSRRPPPLPGR